jgi:two-component sensor histidine kinase
MRKPANGTGTKKAARLRARDRSAARTGKKLGGRAMAEKKAAGDGAERNVDQIRDILFGGQMRDYERRFGEFDARLESELARLRDTQEKRLAEIDRRIDDSLDKLGKLLRQEIQDRNRSLDDLESRLQQAARTARSEVAASLDAHAQEMAATDERLRSALADVAKATHARAGETDGALARLASDLRDEKVGREDLAALLAEFALRLRGDFDLPPPR